ncbi:hypothetical protein GOQ29_11035 [Clostridium sp. D2Q-14]|uniref:hypothetical protein n=1 Tax=Anaeromonas gelatinilytica TaxID=2683194 RepID=UPI00193B239A|nr:hypothetical protein [Anaeromonas gelatinilytica]MBS4536150.1 hypothetical protein [Anaeromonas gelatinilytica]
MLKTIYLIMSIQISMKINSLIYFFKKVPLIKKTLNNINYTFLTLKRFLGVLSILYKLISTPIKTALIFLLTIFLPTYFMLEKNMRIMGILILVFSFHFIIKIISSEILSTDKEKFILVKQMRMHPKDYLFAKIILEKSLSFISKTLIFSIFFTYFDLNYTFGIKLTIMIISFELFIESLHLFLFKKFEFNINDKNMLQLIIFLVITILSYIIAFNTPIKYYSILLSTLTSLWTCFAFLILGIMGVLYIYKYDNYWDIINEKNTIEDFQTINNIYKDAQFGDVKINEKDYTTNDLISNDFSNKEGYAYLNAIFFNRHKRVIYRPMRIKSFIIILSFIVIFIIQSFFTNKLGKNLIDFTINRYTFFIFIIYILSNSNKIVKSMFYNCDMSLLRYGFYKQGDSLLKMFFLRLTRIVYSNIIPIFILCIGLLITVLIYNPSRIIEIIPVLFFIIVLSLFFSVHYIFMYYLFQPYTTDLRIQNPFFSFINGFVYFISYLSLQINSPASIFLPITIFIVIVYMLIAIILVYKKSPKTFRLK